MSADYFTRSRAAMLMEMRTSFALEMRMSFALSGPRAVTRPTADRDRQRLAVSLECARSFRAGPVPWWRHVLRAMASAWWAEWHDATGATYTTTEPGRRTSHAVITGLVI